MTPRERARRIVESSPILYHHDIYELYVGLISDAIQEATREEREACARVSDGCASASAYNPPWDACRKAIADEIRSR